MLPLWSKFCSLSLVVVICNNLGYYLQSEQLACCSLVTVSVRLRGYLQLCLQLTVTEQRLSPCCRNQLFYACAFVFSRFLFLLGPLLTCGHFWEAWQCLSARNNHHICFFERIGLSCPCAAKLHKFQMLFHFCLFFFTHCRYFALWCVWWRLWWTEGQTTCFLCHLLFSATSRVLCVVSRALPVRCVCVCCVISLRVCSCVLCLSVVLYTCVLECI